MDKNEIDIADQAEWLKQIKLTSLSNRALTQASKLAHLIRRANGVVVQLQRQDMAFHLAEQVLNINDDALNNLYRSFLEEALQTDDNQHQTPSKQNKGMYRGVKIDNTDGKIT